MTIEREFDTYDEYLAWKITHNAWAYGVIILSNGKWGMYRMTLVDNMPTHNEGTD